MRQAVQNMILLFIVLFCGQGISHEFQQERTIWQVLPIDEKAVLISDDYEMWLLHGLQPNQLTWGEWIWREEVPQPDPSYCFDAKEWGIGDTVSIIYSPWKSCEWEDGYRNDTSMLESCDYVIENSAYATRVFAKPIEKDDFISIYSDFISEAQELARLGFYGKAAQLLEKIVVFAEFRDKVLAECEKKARGEPFNEEYTAFNKKHELFE